jgi:hypothetical protein
VDEALGVTSALGIPDDLGTRKKSGEKVEDEAKGVGPGENGEDARVLQ